MSLQWFIFVMIAFLHTRSPVLLSDLEFWGRVDASVIELRMAWMVAASCAVAGATRRGYDMWRRSATVGSCGAVTSSAKCATTKGRNMYAIRTAGYYTTRLMIICCSLNDGAEIEAFMFSFSFSPFETDYLFSYPSKLFSTCNFR